LYFALLKGRDGWRAFWEVSGLQDSRWIWLAADLRGRHEPRAMTNFQWCVPSSHAEKMESGDHLRW